MIDYNFEARATAEGYFAAGLALGLDNYKGPYFEQINFFTCGAVEIDYYLDLVGSVSANIAVSGNVHGIDGFKGDVNADLPIKVGIESGGHIKYSLIKMEGGASTKGGASMKAAAMASFKVIVANDPRNRKYAGELYFEGLKATFTLKFFRMKHDEVVKKTPGLQKEDSGKGNEPRINEIDIMDPWEDPIHFPFFD